MNIRQHSNMKREWIVFRDVDPETGGFQTFENTTCTYYWFVQKKFWEAMGFISDQHITHELPKAVQEKVWEDMESHFEYEGSVEEALSFFAENGMVYYGDVGDKDLFTLDTDLDLVRE